MARISSCSTPSPPRMRPTPRSDTGLKFNLTGILFKFEYLKIEIRNLYRVRVPVSIKYISGEMFCSNVNTPLCRAQLLVKGRVKTCPRVGRCLDARLGFPFLIIVLPSVQTVHSGHEKLPQLPIYLTDTWTLMVKPKM